MPVHAPAPLLLPTKYTLLYIDGLKGQHLPHMMQNAIVPRTTALSHLKPSLVWCDTSSRGYSQPIMLSGWLSCIDMVIFHSPCIFPDSRSTNLRLTTTLSQTWLRRWLIAWFHHCHHRHWVWIWESECLYVIPFVLSLGRLCDGTWRLAECSFFSRVWEGVARGCSRDEGGGRGRKFCIIAAGRISQNTPSRFL